MVLRLLPVLCVVSAMLGALANAQTGSGSQSGYTIQANTRAVLTDVTVTDRQGNPVRGLKASDFRIFDNKKPQEIASFEEHSRDDTAPAPQLVSTPDVYSNDYLVHPPRVLNVVFLDLTNVDLEDQMYLRFQLDKFFDALSPNDPVAIYARTGGASILLQGFTSNHALLHAAVKKIMPRFPPFGREYLSDLETLQQIEMYLGQIPGRKNVLWFSGGSTLFLRSDASFLDTQPGMRNVYDELEAQRIAIYPIDARGLTVSSSQHMLAQHALMSEVAKATGGQALYDNNGLALAAERIIHDDGDYYTLTYSPHDFHYDNKWHKVSVTIPGTYYTLSYRHGYFADGTSALKKKETRPRTRLLANGETAKNLPNSTAPIIFQARVVQERARTVSSGAIADSAKTKPPRKGVASLVVRYLLPLDAFEMTDVDGKQTVQCAAAVLAFNDNGTVIAHRAQEITFTLKDEAAADPVGRLLPVDVDIDLSQGDVYLLVAAWDMKSKRVGTVEIPYHADRPKPPPEARDSK